MPPERLTRALSALERWREAGVHLVGIRHHSPGCSTALAALLDEVRPVRILIEGPREYAALAPALTDPRTRPPIAVLSVTGERAAFYPLAEFSPEWVALRWAGDHGAVLDFIDQSYADQTPDDAAPEVVTLQTEHHLARSEAIARLARRLGCRDHDEVWEHLFELRADLPWRDYFADVLAWAGLARIEADKEMLDADGTHQREAVMAAALARHRRADDGPIVVVTGAFHTLALLDVLDATPEAAWVTALPPGDLDAPRPAWLIRYDHHRLDGLRGYGAGMPAPGFWQRVWESRATGADQAAVMVEILLDVAQVLRAEGEQLSAAEVKAAAEQALRLADLRGRAWPGRTDLLDAMLSCFVNDDSGFSGALGEAVNQVFGGRQLGDVPPGLASPPLVSEARQAAEQLRFAVTDSQTRQVSLDTQRKPAHVRRREFLARMRFLGVGFARQSGGADLVTGTGLGQLFEEWEYAWTPLVETALIEASGKGPTLAAVQSALLAERLADPDATSVGIASLITELLVMGEADELPAALRLLDSRYDADPELSSILGSLHRLAGLLTETGRLHLGDQAETIVALLEHGLAAAAYQLSQIAGRAADTLAAACDDLLSLRSLLQRLADLDLGHGASAAITREFDSLRGRVDLPSRLRGCLVGIAHTDDRLAEGELSEAVAAHLHPGADPNQVAAFLLGLLQASPQLILHDEELLTRVDASFAHLDDSAFLGILPDLRQAFTWLKPTETHRLAGRIAALSGGTAADYDTVLTAPPGLLDLAAAIEAEVVASLERDRLGSWGAR